MDGAHSSGVLLIIGFLPLVRIDNPFSSRYVGPMGRGSVTALGVLLAAFGSGANLVAQRPPSPQPLRKTDLIRLLTSTTLSKRDVAAQVRRSCINFVPSARDRADLIAAGADTAVFAAVAECARPAPPLRIVVPPRVRAVTGTEVVLDARVLRRDTPQAGVTLMVRGAGLDAAAVTNANGSATLRFLAGVTPGTYRLELVLSGALTTRPTPIELLTFPASVLRVEMRTPVVTLREASRSAAVARFRIGDEAGRPVPGLRLNLEGITAELGSGITPALTDSGGNASIAILPGSVRRGGQVGLLVGGTRIATFSVVLEAVALHPERTQFMGSLQVRGTVATALVAPVVFQVRDSAGVVVPGYPVAFTVLNGAANPAAAVTDANGVARAVVVLGQRAGPVTITAWAGRISKEVSLYAMPAQPEVLVAERAGTRVERLDLTTRDSVTLRVATRDHFGNQAVQSNVRIQVLGGAVTVRDTRTTAAGSVTLLPRHNGQATLQLQASGLVTTIPITVALPAAVAGWTVDGRVGGAAFNYGFKSITGVSGKPGFRGEVTLGRLLGPALRLQTGLGLGMLRADPPAGGVTVGLYQGLVRGEYALTRGGHLTPVVSLGGGLYRIKSTDPGTVVYHTSLFWMAGAGIDYALGFRMQGVVRLERQQLYEANSQHANGAVGALTVVEVGVRVTP